MILQLIQPYIKDVIPVKQTELKKYLGCEEEVLSLTILIESGFQKKLKTSVAFIQQRMTQYG